MQAYALSGIAKTIFGGLFNWQTNAADHTEETRKSKSGRLVARYILDIYNNTGISAACRFFDAVDLK